MTEKTFHIMVGTKGQLMMITPIMLKIDKRSVGRKFINLNQSSKILSKFINFFIFKNVNESLSLIENMASTNIYNRYYRTLMMINLIAKDYAN